MRGPRLFSIFCGGGEDTASLQKAVQLIGQQEPRRRQKDRSRKQRQCRHTITSLPLQYTRLGVEMGLGFSAGR